MRQQYTSDEIKQEIEVLKNTFDVVRIVDPIMREECKTQGNGNELAPTGCFCFEVWNKNERCSNCISALAISQQTRLTKFEYIGDTLYYIITRYVEIDGKKYVIECVSRLDTGYTRQLADGSEHTKKLIELYREVRIDELTGLYNRRYIVEKLQSFIIDARVNHTKNPVIAFIDIDHLKFANDSFSHNAGDTLIIAVADALVRCFEQNDDNFIARLSGAEFIVCMGNATAEDMKKVVERMIVEVSRTAIKNYPQLKPGISAGVAAFDEANTYDLLMELADKRLKRSKHEGRNRVSLK